MSTAEPRRPRPTDDIDIDRSFQGRTCVRFDPERERPRECESYGGSGGWRSLGPHGTKRDAVRLLYAEGWRFIGGAWVCPACLSRTKG